MLYCDFFHIYGVDKMWIFGDSAPNIAICALSVTNMKPCTEDEDIQANWSSFKRATHNVGLKVKYTRS